MFDPLYVEEEIVNKLSEISIDRAEFLSKLKKLCRVKANIVKIELELNKLKGIFDEFEDEIYRMIYQSNIDAGCKVENVMLDGKLLYRKTHLLKGYSLLLSIVRRISNNNR